MTTTPSLEQTEPQIIKAQTDPSYFCRVCGSRLFETAVAVPRGWIVVWHIDCDGYCPEHAISEQRGDLDKAHEAIATYPDSYAQGAVVA